ncbi:MAG: hypothetical protein M3328_09570 [Chloroflexota bacterium]|nr:hypothetical protein [Chloroflexota bacterium]
MADDLRRLLAYIVEHPVMHNESQEAQRDATAVQNIEQEIAAIAAEHRRDADRLAPYFARGLQIATRGPLVVEDNNQEGSAIAEAFARFLVAPDLATSQSTPLSESHYRYTFEVNWPQLRELAGRAGIDLDRALGQSSSGA